MLRAPSLDFSSSCTLLPASEGRRDKKMVNASPRKDVYGTNSALPFFVRRKPSLSAQAEIGACAEKQLARTQNRPANRRPRSMLSAAPPPSPRAAGKMSSRARDSTKSRRSLQRRNSKTLHAPAVGSVPPPPDGLHVAPSRRTRGDHLERGAKVCGSSAQT